MTASHTPGPWVAEFHGDDASIEIWAESALIADVHSHVFGSHGQDDARLMAAAPDLLEALETLCTGLEWNIENHPTIMNESDSQALAEARAAIAKATGES